jgi:hypothetical protein
MFFLFPSARTIFFSGCYLVGIEIDIDIDMLALVAM